MFVYLAVTNSETDTHLGTSQLFQNGGCSINDLLPGTAQQKTGAVGCYIVLETNLTGSGFIHSLKKKITKYLSIQE